MTAVLDKSKSATSAVLPLRLHHNAWVVEDQERTRVFYEEVLGFPLTQFWIEDNIGPGGKRIILSHAFYGLADGSALAFFSLADPEDREFFKSPKTELFNHVALKVDEAIQAALIERLTQADYRNFHIDHGYCHSLYVTDPDGLRLEFAVDAPHVDEINAEQLRTCHEDLRRWMAGDRNPNNEVRPH